MRSTNVIFLQNPGLGPRTTISLEQLVKITRQSKQNRMNLFQGDKAHTTSQGAPPPPSPLSPSQGAPPPPSPSSPSQGALPPPSPLSPSQGAPPPPCPSSPSQGALPPPSPSSP